MPLEHSKSKPALQRNISTLMHEVGKSPHVQSPAQAIAIAESIKRRGRAVGGAMGAGVAGGGGFGAMPAMSINPVGGAAASPMPAPASMVAPAPASVSTGAPAPPQPMPPAPIAPPRPTAMAQSAPQVAPASVPPPSLPTPSVSAGVAAPALAAPAPASAPTYSGGVFAPSPQIPFGYGYKDGGSIDRMAGGAGDFDMAKAPHVGMTGPAAYPARAMMRGMTRGALLTPTMGRADAHRTFVPSGSYVVPADVVSGRGQGNTLAGAGTLHQMFGMGGPYGAGKAGPYGGAAGSFKAGKGPQMPKPPKMQTSILSASGGGKEGAAEHLGEPVPVNLSGGEVVVPPENLIATFRRMFPGKNYTLKQIHAMMDQWVLDERKQHRKTLAKLPGPAKD